MVIQIYYRERENGAMYTPTILVVDDEEYMINSIERILKRRYRVVSSRSADEAMSELERHKIDLVITDLKMPGMDGIELVRNIKRIDHNIGIIMLTGHGDVDSYLEVINLGAFEYIHKPFENEILLCVVERLLEENEKT